MKKIISLIICLFLCGCSMSEKSISLETDTPTSTTVTIPKKMIFELSTTNHNLKDCKIGNNWAIEGDAEFTLNNSEIRIENANSKGIYYDGLYLDRGLHSFSFSTNPGTSFNFELYDDNNVMIYSENIYSDGEVLVEYDVNEILYTSIIRISNINSEEGDFLFDKFKIIRNNDIENIHINQVGYKPTQRKVAIFPGHNGNYFNIIDANTDKIVSTYPLSYNMYSEFTDEYVAYGDFTNFEIEGKFYIESSFGFKSHVFEISNNVYKPILESVMQSFTLQRCGQEISEELSKDMSHPICHNELGKIYYHETPIDVVGGWHDAGDYGRYIDTGFKALSDLIIAYMDNSEMFDDETNGINSKNGIKDILDEIKYELDWMMKMQDSSGGVHMVASTMNFADIVSPEEDKADIIVFDISPISTAEFSSVMALGSYVFRDIDYKYSRKCLDASLKAYEFAKNNNYEKNMPSEYKSGRYSKVDLKYYRYYMGVALWYATNEKKYYDYAMTQYNFDSNNLYTLNWCPLLFYPSYLILKKADSSYENYEDIKQKFIGHANYQSEMINNNVYRNNLNDVLTWGSNQIVSDNAMQLMMAFNLTGNMEYYDNATELLDYLLGKNCLNKSFVTGYGDDYPTNLHHRTTMSKKTYFKGVLVGGPNMSIEDPAMKKQFDNLSKKAQWMYVDDIDSYSTNETAIQYNSSLLYLLSNIK